MLLSASTLTGAPNWCKAMPLWQGQRINESSGNLYMHQPWLSPVNCKVNVLLWFFTMFSHFVKLNKQEQIMFTEQSKPLSTFQASKMTPQEISVVSMRWQNRRATRLGNIPCLAHLQVTAAPITVLETSSDLRPCKLHRFTNHSV